jgi:hypothetical protein
VDADDGGSVQEAVEHGGGDGGIAERAGPVGDADVGGQDGAGFKVPLVMTWNRAEAPSAGRGRLPRSMTSRRGLPKNRMMEVQRPSMAALWHLAARSAAVVK